MNEVILEALKNLINNMDALNEEYNKDFGEDCPYKADEESEKILRDAVKENKD